MHDTHTDALLIEDFPRQHRVLRVAMVTETYPPEVNGVALTVARVVDGLRANGHEVQLVRPRQGSQELGAGLDADGHEEVLTRGIPIPKYRHLRIGAISKRKLVHLWSRNRPDVVHIATEGPLGWSALQAALHLHLPVCSDFRTNFHAYCRHYGMGWLQKPVVAYLRKFHNRTNCTLVPTEALRQELGLMGFRNLQVLARGVDTVLFNPNRRSLALRNAWGVQPETPVLLSVGRLAPEKNMEALLDAYQRVRAVRPDARLVLVGDGPARASVHQRCPEAIFSGFQTGTALAEHYASADIFLFPSVTETFGNVTPEAMASGLAVVAFDYAAAAQFMRNDDSGCLVALEEPEAFAPRAQHLALDLTLARRMGERARAAVAHVGWAQIVSQVEGVYSQTMNAGLEAPARPMAPTSIKPTDALPSA
jgi:glycosyltransferase involved in cell wall biosynthesis